MNNELRGQLQHVQALQARGDLAQARRLAQQLLGLHPGRPEIHRILSRVELQDGRNESALQHMRAAIDLAPASALLHCELGRLLGSCKRFEQALESFSAATRLDPGYLDAWFLLGVTLQKCGRPGEAAEALRTALALAPERFEIVAALARQESELERHESALALLRRAVGLDPANADCRLLLGETLIRLGRSEEALQLYEESVRHLASSADLWMALAQSNEELGRPDAAEAAYLRALALRPDWSFPVAGLLGLRLGKSDPAWIAAAHRLLDEPSLDDAGIARIGYPLGRVHDARGERELAFSSWTAANRARIRDVGAFDPIALDRQVASVLEIWRPSQLQRLASGSSDERPVFIVGMPRSGTTLVEQIIASHPEAAGCGELPDLGAIGNRILHGPAADAASGLAAEAERYLASAVQHGGTTARRLVDKAPLNFFFVGLMQWLFPHARVIWCRRDARDIGLSVYGENFAPEATFSTDLRAIAQYTNAQHRLMRYWQAHAALPILEVRYEALVTDVEAQSRRIVDFLGLAWDEACLDFHTTQRSVQTPSRWQVRRPANTASIERWRRYEAQLQPLLEALDLPLDQDGVLRS